MTTWQDQEPLSRRALRENERALAQATMPESDEPEELESVSDQQIWSENSIAEPLGYTTQVRRPTTEPESPLLRPRQSVPQRSSTESAAYRLREFGPEGRGTSFSSTQPAPWTPPSSGSEDLSYHTSIESSEAPKSASTESPVAPPVVVTPAEALSASFPPASSMSDGLEEQTLTRRELRERRNAAAAPVEMPVETPEQLPADLRPIQSTELAAAMHEFDAKVRAEAIPALVEPPVAPAVSAPVNLAPVAPAPVSPVPVNPVPVNPVPVAPALITPVPVTPVPATPVPVDRVPLDQAPVAPAPINMVPPAIVPAPPVAPQPAPQAFRGTSPQTPAPAVLPHPESATEPEAEPLREVISAPEVYSAPAGHWSRQAGANDQNQGQSGPHKRDISASDAITTSALVMPNFSVAGPTTGPVSGTGQVLMTGSIDLPRSLGVSGLHPSRYDRADIDSIIDAGDREDAAPDSAPVRAVRAVSTYTSSQGIIATKRPRDSNLPMVLSITAGVMMVGVVVLVVAGMIFKIF